MAVERVMIPSRSSFNSTSSFKSDRSSKPRELRVEYQTALEAASIVGTERTDLQINTDQIGLIYCAPKLKRALKVAWTAILIAYAVVVPVLILLLDKDATDSISKLDDLENRWDIHVKQESLSSSKEGNSREARDVPPNVKDLYSRSSGTLKRLESRIEKLSNEFSQYEASLKNLDRLEVWINQTYLNTSYKGCRCRGLPGIPGQPGKVGLPGSRGSQGRKGSRRERGPHGSQGPSGRGGERGKRGNCSCHRRNSRGPQGPMGSPGPPGPPGEETELRGPKGAPGPRGIKGVEGDRGQEGPEGAQGKNASCSCPNVVNDRSTVYIRWGRHVCPHGERISKIYSGFIGSGDKKSDKKGGTNYLCLLDNKNSNYRITYSERARTTQNRYRGSVDGILVKNKISGRVGTALCAACKVNGKTSSITIPADTKCPKHWTKQYKGFLMVESGAEMRTEFICVDENAQISSSNPESRFVGKLDYVSYTQVEKLDCVVCTI